MLHFQRVTAQRHLLDHLHVVRIVHDPQNITKGVHHRRGHEPGLAALGDRIILLGTQLRQPRKGRLDIVDVPEQDRAAGSGLHPFGRIASVDDAELVFCVADAELDVGGRLLVRHLEIRLDAEQLSIPVARCDHVVGEVVHCGHATEKVLVAHCPNLSFVELTRQQ